MLHRYLLSICLLFLSFAWMHCTREESAAAFSSHCLCQPSCPQRPMLQAPLVIHLPVSGLQYDFDITTVYQKDNIFTFWGYNKYEAKFYIYDLIAQQLLDTIRIASIGEQAIPEIFGFQAIAPDSILVHTNHYNQLILINGQGEKLKTWTITGDLPNGGRSAGLYYLAVSGNYNNFYYDKSTSQATFFVLNTGFDGAHPVERFTWPQFATMDLSNGQLTAAYGEYPAIYHDAEKSDYEFLFPFAVANGKTWAVFNSSHCVYAFAKNKNRQSFCLRSHFMPDEPEMLPRGLKASERDPKLIVRGNYYTILYDTHRRLFYRIVIHNLPEGTPVGRDWQLKKQARWSVMIFDDTGQCFGETVFEPGVYDFDHVFATREGLLISLENPYNADNEEEMLSFALIDIDRLIKGK